MLLLTAVIAAAVDGFAIAAVAAWGAPTAGILTGLFSVGGVLGGLAYGRRQWPGSLAGRPVLLAGCSAACYAATAVAYLPAVSGAALLLAGACADVLLVTTYQLVNVLVREESRTEAGAWLNTAFNLGAAAGSAGGGLLVDRSGSHLTFAAVAALTGLCSLAGASGQLARLVRRGHRR